MKTYHAVYNLLRAQGHYQILLITFLKEFIKLNAITDTIKIKIVTVPLNTRN